MAINIARRKFIAALGGTAFAWPLAVRAQQPGKLPTIGFMSSDVSSFTPFAAAFTERLTQLGWAEGRTIAIEYRWSEGRPERVAEIAAEFARQKVDIIVTYGGAVTALKQQQRPSPSSLQSRLIRLAVASSTSVAKIRAGVFARAW
jgi:putative tryptophan/tyrosine transport system substrate-binding protein